jgi:hypothetical protein
MILTRTVPSLQGTSRSSVFLVFRLYENLEALNREEPISPSPPNPGLRDNVNKTEKLIENKNRQCLTGSHKTFGWKWLFGHSSTLQLLLSVDTKAASSPKRFMPPNRYRLLLQLLASFY